MNKFQHQLNVVTYLAYTNHIMNIKLKYEDKWLPNGTPCTHPIYIAYEREFNELSYNAVRKIVKKHFKDFASLYYLKSYFILKNIRIYFKLFNEDIKYNNR